MITAIDRYDESLHGYFSSYASLWIRQVLDRYALCQKSLIHIPVHAYDLLLQIEKIIEPYPFDITMKNKEKIASTFNISIQETERAMALLQPIISLDEYDEDEQSDISAEDYYYDDETSDILNCIELSYNDVEEKSEDNDLRSKLYEVLNSLSEKENRILLLRTGLFDGNEYTLEQVGNYYGVTRERIRQIEAKAVRKLRHPSRQRKIKDFY